MQNLEKKEDMIMRDGKFATIMKHQEEDKAQKYMEKEQWAMSSTPTGKSLTNENNIHDQNETENNRTNIKRYVDRNMANANNIHDQNKITLL